MNWDNISYVVEAQKFPEEVKMNWPERLYKYRNWEDQYHKSILTKQEVYFSPANSFVDPYDCHFPVNFDFSYEEFEEAIIQNYKKRPQSSLKAHQIKSLTKFYYNEGWSTPERREFKRKEFYRIFNDHLGILCLCTKNDVLSMWDEYANKFDGFSVGFALREHLAEIQANSIHFTTINYVPMDCPPINYTLTYKSTDIEIMGLYIRFINTKYENFKHENEFRLVKIPSDPDSHILNKEERLFRVPKPAFTEVIMGYNMSQSSIKEIIKVCREQDLQVAFKVASPNQDGTVQIQDY